MFCKEFDILWPYEPWPSSSLLLLPSWSRWLGGKRSLVLAKVGWSEVVFGKAALGREHQTPTHHHHHHHRRHHPHHYLPHPHHHLHHHHHNMETKDLGKERIDMMLMMLMKKIMMWMIVMMMMMMMMMMMVMMMMRMDTVSIRQGFQHLALWRSLTLHDRPRLSSQCWSSF